MGSQPKHQAASKQASKQARRREAPRSGRVPAVKDMDGKTLQRITPAVNDANAKPLQRIPKRTSEMTKSKGEITCIEYPRKSQLWQAPTLTEVDKQILETDLGDFEVYEGELVPLDCPMIVEEKEEKQPELNKPKVGGPKKYYVYVKDGDKIKKVTWDGFFQSC